MISRKDKLDEVLFTTLNQFQDLASEVLNRKIYLRPSRNDQLKLLNFYTWADKYGLSRKELLSLLLQVWAGKYSKSKGLGISISTLLGKKSKEIVIAYVKKTYKSKENFGLLRQQAIEKIIPPIVVEEVLDPFEYITTYRARLDVYKEKDEKLAKKFKRRRWRGNPFL